MLQVGEMSKDIQFRLKSKQMLQDSFRYEKVNETKIVT